jgi:hypothetical protein
MAAPDASDRRFAPPNVEGVDRRSTSSPYRELSMPASTHRNGTLSLADFHERHEIAHRNMTSSFLVKNQERFNLEREHVNLSSKRFICSALQAIATSPELFPERQPEAPPRVFMDLGCGNGKVMLAMLDKAAIKTPWMCCGVDIDEQSVANAKSNLKAASGLDFIHRAYQEPYRATFYPADFAIVPCSENKGAAALLEASRGASSWEDAAASMRINHSDVDLFFHYQIVPAVNIINLFAEFAKKGAILVFVPSSNDMPETLPDSVESVGTYTPRGAYIHVLRKR